MANGPSFSLAKSKFDFVLDTWKFDQFLPTFKSLSAFPDHGCAKPDLLDAGDCGPGDAPPGPVWVHELGIPNLVLDIHILAATKLIPTQLL